MRQYTKIFLLLVLFALGSGIYKVTTYVRSAEFAVAARESALGVEELVPLSGTGSMFPTFPKGQGTTYEELSTQTVATPGMFLYPSGLFFDGKRYFEWEIGFGDIVSFFNETTKKITSERTGKESGFVKRVIGLGGDVLELRNGIVYRNKEALKEPYTARAQSTFGGDFLLECHELKIPEGSLFVMGDNRKGSNDSRYELGLIKNTDVTHFIPYEKQIGRYDQRWRDISKDLELDERIKLDVPAFMKRLNDKRKEEKLTALRYNDKLEKSARKRAETMLKTNDFSFEATRSGYTMSKALAEVGYSNIIWGEAPLQGYYESDELYESSFEFSNMRKFLLDSEYQEFGIAEVQGELNGCPTQAIVMHVAGYRPPNYSKDVIDSWKTALEALKASAPGWRDAR